MNTREEFEIECNAFLKTCNSYYYHQHNQANNTSSDRNHEQEDDINDMNNNKDDRDYHILTDWYLQKEECYYNKNRNEIILFHKPIIRTFPHATTTVTNGNDDNDDNEYANINDVINDDNGDDSEPNTKNDNNYNNNNLTEWKFHILYNETYKIPMLYFTIQSLDGSTTIPYHDTILSNYLSHNDKDIIISQEEHPMYGMPYYIIHSCFMHNRLNSLIVNNKNDNDDGDKGSSSSLGEGCKLLIWLMMIAPIIKCKILYKDYKFLYNKMMENQI